MCKLGMVSLHDAHEATAGKGNSSRDTSCSRCPTAGHLRHPVRVIAAPDRGGRHRPPPPPPSASSKERRGPISFPNSQPSSGFRRRDAGCERPREAGVASDLGSDLSEAQAPSVCWLPAPRPELTPSTPPPHPPGLRASPLHQHSHRGLYRENQPAGSLRANPAPRGTLSVHVRVLFCYTKG